MEAVGGVKHKNKPKAKGKQAGDKKPKVARVKSIYEVMYNNLLSEAQCDTCSAVC